MELKKSKKKNMITSVADLIGTSLDLQEDMDLSIERACCSLAMKSKNSMGYYHLTFRLQSEECVTSKRKRTK